MSWETKSVQYTRASRMLRYALTLGVDAEAWNGLSLVLRFRLTAFERACILTSTIRSMDIDDASYVIETILRRDQTGMPMPPFLDPIDDATWWAGIASIKERKAVLTAAFLSLPARDRDEFLACVNRRAAA